jgi:hypothetical protein
MFNGLFALHLAAYFVFQLSDDLCEAAAAFATALSMEPGGNRRKRKGPDATRTELECFHIILRSQKSRFLRSVLYARSGSR